MKKKLLVLFSLFLIGCSSGISDYQQLLKALGLDTPSPDYKSFYSESLHHAVALEKLPDVRFLLLNDTIDVFVAQINDSSGYLYDAKFNDDFPFHVDRWYLRKLTLSQIKLLAEKRDVHYLTIFSRQDGSDYIIEIIDDTYLKKDSDKFIMDRGRLSIRFVFDKIWRIEEIIKWYG